MRMRPRRESAPRAKRTAKAVRRRYLAVESLEGRVVLSWPGVPPSSIPVPTNAVPVTLDRLNDASGTVSKSCGHGAPDGACC